MLKKMHKKKKAKKSSKEKAELLTMAKDKEYKEMPPSGIKFAFWHSGCLLHTGFGQQLSCGKQPISMSGRLQLQWLERVGHSLLPGCNQRLLQSQATVTVNIIIDDLWKSRGLYSASTYRHGLYIQVHACR